MNTISKETTHGFIVCRGTRAKGVGARVRNEERGNGKEDWDSQSETKSNPKWYG